MIQCPKCSADNPADNRFCGTCGEELSSISQAPTVAVPEGEVPLSPAISPNVGRIVSSDSVPAGGFTPGTILADRYRIIGLLGRGGMGEVYRADDLKLGQPVALKFLPPALAEDSVRRERFFAEVRITRQLSHPNICRVYDIGEVDGRHFLSMEYIDGEDLASLMKRIGHLSNEKALDIARQLLAGLSVAHERGVLHRDLKPANIMLDGHGRVRITDFGLAIAVGDESQAEEIAGTPAYMAPEQLAGKGATVRSDIYSLGLILYEIYTGKKAFKAKTLAELREQKETQTPRAPSELREGIDAVVERVIQRCMEKDPNARPTSVAQLAQSLPGGDPLAAAIAAGETPSPEMVAASGSKEGLKPAVAWGFLGCIIMATLALIALRDFNLGQISINKRPDVLVEKAREIINKTGYTGDHKDSVYGFIPNNNLLRYRDNSERSINESDNLDKYVLLFYYRQSEYPLEIPLTLLLNDGKRTPFGYNYFELPLKYSGDAIVVLDTEGNLISFRIMPPKALARPDNVDPVDWELFFNEADLVYEQREDIAPQQNPSIYADTLYAWQSSLNDRPEYSFRVEAAAFKDKPVSFEIIGPWNDPEKMKSFRLEANQRSALIAFELFLLVIVIGGFIFARQNIRLGRGDRRNAARLAIFIFGVVTLRLVLYTRHDLVFIQVFQLAAFALIVAGILWIIYIALEPFVRRRWPHILVSWTRLLSGQWRDPLVARDVLIGCTFGAFMASLDLFLTAVIPRFLGSPSIREVHNNLETLLGIRGFVSTLLYLPVQCIFLYTGLLGLLFIFRLVLRNQRIAASIFILFGASLTGIWDPGQFVTMIVLWTLGYFILMRFGFLAVIIQMFTTLLMFFFPITFDTNAWYSPYGFAALLVWAAIVLYAFHTSLGGRPMFGTPRLED